MSYSQGSVKTEYVDPVSFVPNQRCSFELGATKMAYLPNLRLLNVGCTNTSGNKVYNFGIGAQNLIKNIRLMDARTELTAQRNLGPYALFNAMMNTNDVNKSSDMYLKRSTLGFEINGANNKVQSVYDAGSSTNDPNTTNMAYLDLREMLPLLGRIPILPTKIFQNLRLEIEFDSNTANQMMGENNLVIDIQRPILAVDYVDEERIVGPMVSQLTRGVQWNEIEWDNFLIPAVDTSTWAVGDVKQQQVNNQSLGFRGKTIDRLLICKQAVNKLTELNGATVLGFGAPISSQALLKEQFQIRLNGKNVFPGHGGVVGSNQMLGTLVDAYGDHQAYPGSNLYKWTGTDDTGLMANPNFTGQSAWDCCEIGAKIADLQISITRNNNRDAASRAPTNQPIQVNLYAEVHKVISFANGRYAVVYA